MENKLNGVTLLLCCFLLILNSTSIRAQVIPLSEDQVMEELTKRGITEEEATLLLEKEGLDIDDLENLSTEEILRLQTVLDDYQNQKKEVTIEDKVDTIEIEEEIPIEKEEIQIPMLVTDSSTTNNEHIYGQSLFSFTSSQIFDNGENFSAPDSYILGVGDKIAVSAYGNSQFEETFIVDKDGYINILDNKVRVLIKGLTLDDARIKLRKKYSQYYQFNNGEFDVSLLEYREVQISVFGEARQIGTFTIPASNSVFNALAAVGGPNDKGSLRRIQLLKASGGSVQLDIYEFLENPSIISNYYLSNNDVIHIPNQGNIVNISGAVKRPMKYELLETETLSNLLAFAGNFEKDAIKNIIQVVRYKKNKRVLIDVEQENIFNFQMMNGDSVIIRTVNPELQNVVSVNGAVVEQGYFELESNMSLLDLINRAKLKPESYLQKAVLKRENPDQTITLEFIDISKILNNPKSQENYSLKKNDELIIWPKSKFVDKANFSIDGAVREKGIYPYDSSNDLAIKDAIFLAGGLRRDAGKMAIIHRRDPLLTSKKEYITLNLENDADLNVILEPFDRIEILSENYFSEESFIWVEGAVNSPNKFQYGKHMKVIDALALAKGFKLAAQTNNIEVSRVIIKNNEPTETVIANLVLDRNLNAESSTDALYELHPYDRIFVRYVPDFQLQQNILIKGEVRTPGPYSILSANEKISSLIKRAGGLTQEAFPQGAKLYRKKGEEKGFIVMRLDEVLKKENSRYNYILKDGDILEIPKQKDFITIRGAIRVDEMVSDETIGSDNEIQVAYHKGENAKFYIDYYAGGLSKHGSRRLIFVEHANGELKQTKRSFIFGHKYPEVQKGSIITARYKPVKKKKNKEQKDDVDWTKVLGDSVAQAMSILTLILLIQRID